MAKEEKLDWIYKGATSLVDREEYLLGRKVDKTLDQINEEEKAKKFVLPTPKNHVEHECIPPSIRDFNKIVQAEQVDLSAKLQEDPLVAIKKREEEARRQFLQNPVQLKKLQEALKKQQDEKQKHNKSKKKHSDSELDEKLKEKFKLLRSSALGMPKKTKKGKEDALNTILMHKFNALKDKLSEEDLQDIINGKISDGSDEDKPKKKKKKKEKEDSTDSDSNRKKRKNKKNRDSDSSEDKDKKRDRSSSGSNSDTHEKIREKSSTRRQRDYSSEKNTRDRDRSPYKKRDSNKSYPRESSSENKYKTGNRIRSNEKSSDTRSKRKTSRSRQGRSQEIDLQKEISRSSSNTKQRSRSRSHSDEGRVKSTHDRQDNSKLMRQKYKRGGRERASSSESASDKYRKTISKTENKINDKSDCDLDEKIMAKLRILRGEVEMKTQKNIVLAEKPAHSRKETDDSSSSSDDDKYKKEKLRLPAKPPHLKTQKRHSDAGSSEKHNKPNQLKTLLPEKPPHLRLQSKSSDTSSSEENTYRTKYSDSEEEQQPKSFGLVSSDGKKIALKKSTDYKKVDTKAIRNATPSTKPERKQIKKLTEKEKDRLREEMMRNAQVRDKEREKNVKKYRETDKKEQEMVIKKFDADLVHTELLKSAKHSSVEQRIKSNLNNIQRSSRHMDSNFSKR